MSLPFRESIHALAAEYPFAVVIRDLEEPVILIPVEAAHSSYDDVRITDGSLVRQRLAAAAADSAIDARARRIGEIALPGADLSRVPTAQLVEAIAEAVSGGRIYAIPGADGERSQRAGRRPVQRLNYLNLLAALRPEEVEDFLFHGLPDLWAKAYAEMPKGGSADLVIVTDEGYRFLFDLSAERVVAAYGRSRYNPEARDSGRMQGFLGTETSQASLKAIAAAAKTPQIAAEQVKLASMSWRDRFILLYKHKYDRGHFMSHRQGGGLDINLFPQLAHINQGRSALGAEYRAMERTCVANPGVFVFSRPIYDDDSWVPVNLDYGLVWNRNRVQVATFPNREA